ncbi:MAG: PIN domain-containing protein [Armatimonadota bacterium]
MEVVLDASAMLAYLRKEAGAEYINRLLLDDQQTCLAHAVNACEVYYDFIRIADESAASSAIADLLDAGLTIRKDLDATFWMTVGQYKVKYRISIADCFGITLAHRLGTSIVTADHHEFDKLVGENICPIQFIR